MKAFYSEPRLNSYAAILQIHERDVIQAHHWNTAICSSLYPVLQAFELTLRNAINNAAFTSDLSPYKRDNWWFETIATEVQNKKIRQMNPSTRRKWLNRDNRTRNSRLGYFEKNVESARRLLADQRRPVTASAVLSRQSFGFWVGMLDKDFEDRNNNQRFLWPHLLNEVFPNAPVTINISVLQAKAYEIKNLRNRISHHEPIWKFFNLDSNNNIDYNSPVIGVDACIKILRSHYNAILEYIEWMSKDSYKELTNSGLCDQFEFLCSIDGFHHFLDKSRRSPISERLVVEK